MASTWVLVFTFHVFFKWWLGRGGRWDGRGELLQLVMLAQCAVTIVGLVANLLSLGSYGPYTGVSDAARYTVPLLALYGVLVHAEALHAATGVARRYALDGVLTAMTGVVLAALALAVVLA